MMFDNESDVRRWVKRTLGDKVRWVEPALGSTLGLPDCFLLEGGEHYWMELKMGQIKGGKLVYSVTNEQKKELIRMKKDGAKMCFLIGIGDGLVACSVDQNSVNGAVDLYLIHRDERGIEFMADDRNAMKKLKEFIGGSNKYQVPLMDT